jgi:hypothetical protein
MDQLRPILWLLPVLLLLFGCPQGPSEGEPAFIKPYYYPVEDLWDGRVYEYRWNLPDMPPYYAYMVAVPDSSGQRHLVTTEYSEDFEPLRIFRERILADGALLVDCRWAVSDTALQNRFQAIQVVEGNSFPWYARPDSVLAFRRKMNYTTVDEGKSLSVTDVKDRFFQGPSPTPFVFKGKPYPCMVFLAKTTMMYQREDGVYRSGSFSSTEYYAEGLGLVRIHKTLPNGEQGELLLQNVYTMPEFEALQTSSTSPR